MRRQRHALVVGIVLLAGCGARTSPAIGFVNQTHHSDSQLWSLWKAAQQNLCQQIDLNPLPGDSRVWNVSPRQLVVSSQADVSSAALYAATGTNRPNPTGLISCPAPCNVNYAAAYSLYSTRVSRYAASWEFSGNNFDVLVQYEFENQILDALGYDMTWR